MIDVGSGKGYLSENLAMFHGLTVVGIDSRTDNTAGAVDRCSKMEKMHRRLLKSESVRQDPRGEEKSGDKSITVDVDSPIALTGAVDDSATEYGTLLDTGREFHAMSASRQEKREDTAHATCQHYHSQMCVQEYAASATFPMTEGRPDSSYLPFTHCVRVDDDIMQLAEDHSQGKLKTDSPTLIVGLHTCGDLGSTTLRLFTRIPSLHAVCLASCCYQHISELCTDPTGIVQFLLWCTIVPSLEHINVMVGQANDVRMYMYMNSNSGSDSV